MKGQVWYLHTFHHCAFRIPGELGLPFRENPTCITELGQNPFYAARICSGVVHVKKHRPPTHLLQLYDWLCEKHAFRPQFRSQSIMYRKAYGRLHSNGWDLVQSKMLSALLQMKQLASMLSSFPCVICELWWFTSLGLVSAVYGWFDRIRKSGFTRRPIHCIGTYQLARSGHHYLCIVAVSHNALSLFINTIK